MDMAALTAAAASRIKLDVDLDLDLDLVCSFSIDNQAAFALRLIACHVFVKGIGLHAFQPSNHNKGRL